MFYDRLNLLCAERGITVSKLLEELGLAKSSASRWKTKGYMPSKETLKKIADYFNIPVAQLMDIDIKKSTPEIEDGINELDLELLSVFKTLTAEQKRLVLSVATSWIEK